MAHHATEVEVVFPYTPTESNQLTLRPGERLHVQDTTSRGWWIGVKADGAMGLFPSSYCKPVEATDAKTFNVPLEEKRSSLLLSTNSNDTTSLVSSHAGSPSSMQRRAAQRNARQHALMSELGIGDEDSGGGFVGSDAFGPRGGGSSGQHDKLVDEVATLRKLRAAVEEDIDKINTQARETSSSLDTRAQGLRGLTEQRQEVVAEIKAMDAELTELNKVNEVLRCAFMGEPLPDYDGGEDDAAGAASSAPAAEPEVIEEVVEQTESDDDEPPAEPGAITSPDDIPEDAGKGKKTAVKLIKRIEEAREVEASYAKKLHKLEKKQSKLKGAIDEEKAKRAEEDAARASAASESERALAAEVASAKAQLEKAMSTFEALDAELAALDKAKAKALKKIKKGDAAKAEVESQLAEAKGLVSGSDEDLRDLERQVADLTAELAKVNAGVSEDAIAQQKAALEAEEAAKSADVAARIAKEQSRIAEYQKAIDDAIAAQKADGGG